MKIQKFEDMKVWQDAREFVKQIYKCTANQKFKKDFGLRDQIQRGVVSIMSNIAEGLAYKIRNTDLMLRQHILWSCGVDASEIS